MIRRINLFGGPGCGKSTVAASIYAGQRADGASVELVQEYIKNWAYENRKCVSFDQLYVFSKQLHAEDILLRSGVGAIISDSPLVMQLAYVKKYGVMPIFDELAAITTKFERQYPSFNILLDRKGIPYEDNGRYEDEEAAIVMDKLIEETVEQLCPNYERMEARKIPYICHAVAQKL